MPFTITKIETGIKCPVDNSHKGGVYGLIYIKTNKEFYLCTQCTTLFEWHKLYGYVPLKPDPLGKKQTTLTDEGVRRLLEGTKNKNPVVKKLKTITCADCHHPKHGGICPIVIFIPKQGSKRCGCKEYKNIDV